VYENPSPELDLLIEVITGTYENNAEQKRLH